jgi:hypothetical protein
MKLRTRILLILNDLLRRCPKCGQEQHNLTGQAHFSGHEQKTCIGCQHAWTEASFILNKEKVFSILLMNNFNEEAAEIKDLSLAIYNEFIAQNFEIRPLLN